MFRVLYPIAWTEATRCARRLPELPRARLIVAARWLVTILALWLVLRSIHIGTVLDLIARAGLTGRWFAIVCSGSPALLFSPFRHSRSSRVDWETLRLF